MSSPDPILDYHAQLERADPIFSQAVAAIDAGEVDRLRGLLARHPRLVTARAKVDGPLAWGYFRAPTLLHFVANNPNRHPVMPPCVPATTQAILDAGAEVDARTPHPNGGTTLALVASSEPAKQAGVQIPLVELLVKNGAAPGEGLVAALYHGYMPAVEALFRLGATHVLFTAAGMGLPDVLRDLLTRNPAEEERLRAADIAAARGHLDCLALLLETGLDINARIPGHPYGPTLLHQAAWNGRADIVKHLVRHGADPTVRDTQFGSTPAGWARHAKHETLAAWIEAPAPGDW